MIDLWTRSRSPFAREQAVRRALAPAGVQLTSRQLANRGASWRTVMDLLASGEVEIVGVTARAQVLYQRRERTNTHA